MKVILLRDTARLGKRGEVKDVSDGYAVNVLLPKLLAVHATPSELAKWKQKEASAKQRKESVTANFMELIHILRGKEIIVGNKKHDAKGQLFAQVKEGDIAQAIFDLT